MSGLLGEVKITARVKSVCLFAVLWGVTTIHGLVYAAETKKPPELPLETFFKKPTYTQMTLSPNGQYLAALAPVNKRQNLVVIDLASRASKLVTNMESRDISGFTWVNDDRLVFTMDGDGNESFGLFAVNRDGSKARTLVDIPKGQVVLRYAFVVSRIPNSEEILVSANDRSAEYPDIYRMNTVTGRRTLLTFDNPGKVAGWLIDHQQRVRFAVKRDGEEIIYYHRTDEKAPWEKIASFGINQPNWFPLSFTADNQTLYVASNLGRDKYAIYTYDLTKKAMGELLFEHPDVDVTDVILAPKTHQLLGFSYQSTKSETTWVDARYQSLQKGIDNALGPSTLNRFGSISEAQDRFIVRTFSDRDPGEFYLLEQKENKKLALESIGKVMEWVQPAQMAEIQAVSYAARDGLKIPAYLTLPPGREAKDLPLIVNPHGGPQARDGWGFNPEVQFLANRGYAVLQMNFRGSTGYGTHHQSAGYKQWGRAMQDDITDGVQWLIKAGKVDPKRICIFGGSYGGYATLMGLVATPELYQCGINVVGVTDIGILFDNFPPAWEAGRLEAYQRFGNPEKDKAYLQEVSPVTQAKKIRVPLLNAYGARDPRVSLKHLEALESALEKAGRKKDQDFWSVIYQDEGHGFRKSENVMDFYGRIDRFLKKNLPTDVVTTDR